MAITAAHPAAAAAAAAGVAAWIEQLQKAVEAASAEARGALFYYAGFGLYFAIAVAGTSHEDLLRGERVAMPGLGIDLPLVGFYLFVPLLFVVFHVYTLLQLVVLARRVGQLKVALRRHHASAERRQRLLVSPFAVSQRLFGEPPGPVPQTVLASAIWFTLVLIPLALLLATQLRFLPYHAAEVTWPHRIYLLLDALLLLFLWPQVVHPGQRGALAWLITAARRTGGDDPGATARAGAAAVRRRVVRRHRSGGGLTQLWRSPVRTAGTLTRGGLAALMLLVAFVVATIPGEPMERKLLAISELLAGPQQTDLAACNWFRSLRLPDRRRVLCVTYALLEAPGSPLGLRRNMVVRDASLVVAEPSQQQIEELGFEQAWRSKGDGVDLQNRDLRFADLSGSDLRRADLRGANLERALLHGAKLIASRAGDIENAEAGACMYQPDDAGSRCVTGLVDADLSAADLRLLEGWKSDLQGADLSGARLEDAELGHARLDAALLVWARLDRAKLDGASLTGAVLREASAPEVRLNDAKLGYAFMRQADLAKANLTDVHLEHADVGRIKVDDAIYRRDQPYSALLRLSEGPRPPEPPIADHGPAAEAAADPDLELTVDLFERACPSREESTGEPPVATEAVAEEPEEKLGEGSSGEPQEERASETLQEKAERKREQALQARGVVQRLWHEFDYSMSHDREGYAKVADLRYLLARQILTGRDCPRAEAIDEQHRALLRKFLTEWCAWRYPQDERDGKDVEPELKQAWRDLRPRVLAIDQAAAAGDKVVTEIWQRLDRELGPYRSCPELSPSARAQADEGCAQSDGCGS